MSDISLKVARIFFTNPTKEYLRREIASIILRNNPETSPKTIDSALRRHVQSKRIGKRRKQGYNIYGYKLGDITRMSWYLDEMMPPQLRPTPSPPSFEEAVPAVPHHKQIRVTITDDQFKRLEHRFSKPKPNDRACQRTFNPPSESFSLTVSQNTLNGILNVKEPNWLADVEKYLGETFAKEIGQCPMSKGVSVDWDIFKDWIIKGADYRVAFTRSHFPHELDIEGSEESVNTYLQYLANTAHEETDWQAKIAKSLEIQNQRTKVIEQQLLKQGESVEMIGKAVAELFKDLVKSKEPKEEVKDEPKEFTDCDAIMYS